MREVGVLALQGGVEPHLHAVARLGHGAHPVRRAADLVGCGALVLPGGESTTQRSLLAESGLDEALDAFVAAGHPVLATCAGLILAAARGWIDADIRRNGWGRQLHSFEAIDDAGRHPLMFIRAPRIDSVGPRTEVLARYRGEPVLVRQGSVVGATFHPELSGDDSIHALAFR